MNMKVHFIIAIMYIAIVFIPYLHNCESIRNDRQKVKGTNALIHFRRVAVELFNMNSETNDNIGPKTMFSDKLRYLLKTSSEQIKQGQIDAEYVNAINSSSNIIDEISANIELDSNMEHGDIVAKQNTEKNLNEIIGLMEYKDVKQASNYLKNKRRVVIDQSSKNKELFNKLLTTGVDMFNAVEHNGDSNQLGVCQIRCKMRHDVDEEELKNLEQIANYDIQVDDNEKDKYLIFWILLDKGSSHNLLHSKLKDFMLYDSLGSRNMKMNSSVSKETIDIE